MLTFNRQNALFYLIFAVNVNFICFFCLYTFLHSRISYSVSNGFETVEISASNLFSIPFLFTMAPMSLAATRHAANLALIGRLTTALKQARAAAKVTGTALANETGKR